MWYFQRSRKLFNLSLILGCSAMLSGCGEFNSQFTCPMKPGVTCQSLDQVNTMVDQGKLAEAKPKPAQSSDPVLTVNVSYSADNNEVTRSPEPVMRLVDCALSGQSRELFLIDSNLSRDSTRPLVY